MQDGRADRATYRRSTEFRYSQREQWVAEQVAHAWLLRWAADENRIWLTGEPLS